MAGRDEPLAQWPAQEPRASRHDQAHRPLLLPGIIPDNSRVTTDHTRVPFRASAISDGYDDIDRLPAVFVLENLRSLYNVGAFFRTADAVRLESLHLIGITATPDDSRIAKTALGAETAVPWTRWASAAPAIDTLRARGFEIAVLDTVAPAIDLFDWLPRFPTCVVFGHEIDGVSQDTLESADTRVRIPMLGLKHSLNVATAGGVVAYELLRRRRATGWRGSS
jgi:tRNA G18 (ribose-2'-O)-methylase SpoU